MNVLDRVKRIPGTTSVQIFGAKDYAYAHLVAS